MATDFTRIIDGDLPARFVWRDEKCVAFLDSAPLTDGHVLVVPIDEVDKWTDASDELLAHLWRVVSIIGKAQKQAFPCERIGVMLVGYEIPHLHIHTFPTNSIGDFDMRGKDPDPQPAQLDAHATALRKALMDAGYTQQAGDITA